jgi:hypothetical protein
VASEPPFDDDPIPDEALLESGLVEVSDDGAWSDGLFELCDEFDAFEELE